MLPDRLAKLADEQIINALPHGSGIDCTWQIERGVSCIWCFNSYHLMNDGGYYDGWQDFSVKLFAHKSEKLQPLTGPCAGKVQVVHRKGDIDFQFSLRGGRVRRNSALGLCDYLAEIIEYALSEAGIIDGLGYEIRDAK